MKSQMEHIGFNSLETLRCILADSRPQKILLVTGRTSYGFSGAERRLDSLLEGISRIFFQCNGSSPRSEDVQSGLQIYLKEKPDMVIAVGGGSVIDTAKLIDFFGPAFVPEETCFWRRIPEAKNSVPLIAIPTTAGSGSEATHFAVLYVGEKKYSIEHDLIRPDIAIIDPNLTVDLPAYITACSGMDALSQAIESYWSIHSTEGSKELAARAIKYILSNIVCAVNSPTSENRLAMSLGSHLAGRAIQLTKTTAVHAVSYPMTSYFKIPHGHACGVILPTMFEFVSMVTAEDCLDPRGREYVAETLNEIALLLGVANASCVPNRLQKLFHDVGLERNHDSLGIKSKRDLDIIIRNGFNPERVKNNPRNLTKESLRGILIKSLDMSESANRDCVVEE